MRSKAILVSLIAVFTLIALTMFVSARTLNVSVSTSVNDVEGGGSVVVAEDTGGTLTLKVRVTANENLSDAKVRTYISGESGQAESGKFDLLSGRTYSKTLSLKTPESLKTSPSKSYVLVVSVESNEGDARQTYSLSVQRESSKLEVLSVELTQSVTAGSFLSADVVVKNRGSHKAEDVFVVMRVPALNLEKKVYFGDLVALDDNYDHEDATEGKLSLKMPSDTKAGVYDVEFEVYNDEATAKTTKRVSVAGSEQGSEVLVAKSAQELATGSSTTYDLILVNSGSTIAVYTIVPESSQNLVVSAGESIVTVPAESSRVVKVTVTAGNVIGTYNFAVNVNSKDQLVKRITLTANVVKAGFSAGSNVIVLTVVLAIVFIILLIVLIVLLTRKPVKSEQTEESYY